MFAFRDTCTPDPDAADGIRVEVAFTDATLDLQEGAPGFATSLSAVVEATGVPFARLDQVHGDAVHVVESRPGGTGGTGGTGDNGDKGDAPIADALVTTRRGIGLMVRVADCVPVLLADPVAGAVAAVHAGRVGVTLDVVTRAVDRMRDLGADQVRAWIGPHVCGRCYEVPPAMRSEVGAVVPATLSETSWGTPALDLGAGVAAQLAAADVPALSLGLCTLEDERFHSYRRDGGAAGRFAGLVWIA